MKLLGNDSSIDTISHVFINIDNSEVKFNTRNIINDNVNYDRRDWLKTNRK